MLNCKHCGIALPIGSNPRREFCSDAHRQAYFRERHKADQDAALLSEVEALRAKVATLEQENEEQASLISKLQRHLDVERRFLEDTDRHPFKKFLKEQASSPWRTAFLSHQLIKSQDTRKHYEYAMQYLLRTSEEEHDDFVRLWKLMLLQS